jgi:hypothetical protein
MTVAPNMTVNQFLAGDPRSHSDFQPCDVSMAKPHRKPARLMPALVELIRRVGGLDAVPVGVANLTPDTVDWNVIHREGTHWDAELKRRDSGRVLARMHRSKFGKLTIEE